MRIRLTHPDLRGDLRDHFQRAGFRTEELGRESIQVRRPDAPDSEQERREVEIHLRVWQARHPSAGVELLD